MSTRPKNTPEVLLIDLIYPFKPISLIKGISDILNLKTNCIIVLFIGIFTSRYLIICIFECIKYLYTYSLQIDIIKYIVKYLVSGIHYNILDIYLGCLKYLILLSFLIIVMVVCPPPPCLKMFTTFLSVSSDLKTFKTFFFHSVFSLLGQVRLGCGGLGYSGLGEVTDTRWSKDGSRGRWGC